MLPKQSTRTQRDKVIKVIIESYFRDPVRVLSYGLKEGGGISGVFSREYDLTDVYDFEIAKGRIKYSPRNPNGRKDRNDTGIPVQGRVLSEEEYEELSEVDEEDIRAAVEDWTRTAPERFKDILNAES